VKYLGLMAMSKILKTHPKSVQATHMLVSVCLCVCVVKYLGLMAMSKILKTHPKSVQAHKDLILQCLDDKDESIRLRALDLLYGMVSSDTPPVSQ